MTLIRLLAATAALLHGTLAFAQQPAPFPLEPGLTWSYRGIVRWSGGADQRVHRDSIQWTMQVVAVRSGPDVRAALVRGWVQELAWHEPSNTPPCSALVARDGRLFHIEATDSASAVEILDASVRAAATAPLISDLVIDSTLTVNHVYGQESGPRRNDFMYAWHVESATSVAAPAAWKAGTTRVRRMRIVHRTLPDHQYIDYVPGIGITRFVYSHHGSVADTDVRLVSVTR